MALRDADLKGQQVTFARGALGDGDVDRVASALLIVKRIVLDIADDMLRLGSFNEACDESPGEDRIFAEILKCAPIAGFARKVSATAERHVVALCTEFAADQLAIFVCRIRVPTGRSRHVRGQGRGVAAVDAARANAVSGIAHIDAGDT